MNKETNADISRDAHQDAALSSLIKARATHHEAPDDLRERIQRALLQQDAQASMQPAIAPRSSRWSQWFGLGAAFACGLLVSFAVTQVYTRHAADQALRTELLSSHTRSLMEAHLTDVASSEKHTVRPWFTGKLDYAPPVFDFASDGFPLAGGRLDYIGKRRVAALVYRAGLHTVNIFVWPDKAAASEHFSLDGFNVSRLNAGGMQFWAVSDLEMEQLDKLTALIRTQLATATR